MQSGSCGRPIRGSVPVSRQPKVLSESREGRAFKCSQEAAFRQLGEASQSPGNQRFSQRPARGAPSNAVRKPRSANQGKRPGPPPTKGSLRIPRGERLQMQSGSRVRPIRGSVPVPRQPKVLSASHEESAFKCSQEAAFGQSGEASRSPGNQRFSPRPARGAPSPSNAVRKPRSGNQGKRPGPPATKGSLRVPREERLQMQ
ncbi:hypothetical protein NDU88_004318 [Pleurodeles waltl]|uniref:Uncharacterized protein n=1 Tax=Pleurodeles waltl TaxID=8319 RepID=A0AAV7M9K7_PLEWA|nr:hypothetical protein NDU88_004318 [Pleurodeles waltl]